MLLLLPLNLLGLALAQDTGSIAVTVKGNVQGRIYVDGQDTGLSTPNVVRGIAPGNHLVQVLVQDQCLGALAPVDVTPGREASIEPALMTMGGFVQIRATPPGTTVTLDGRAVSLPYADELTCGAHVLEASAPGYLTERREVNIEMGSAPTFVFELMEQGYGSVQLQVEPPGARVLIDGKQEAVGSQTINQLPSGVHTLRVELDGYTPYEQSVAVKANATQALTVKLTPLQPLPGTLPEAPTPTGRSKKVAGGALLGGGLVAAGVGAASYFGARGTYVDEYLPLYKEGRCQLTAQEGLDADLCAQATALYMDEINTPYKLGVGLMVAGGALAASGGVLLFVDQDQVLVGFSRRF